MKTTLFCRPALALPGLLLAVGVATARPAAPADTLVTYLDKHHAALPSAEGAAYRVKTAPTDSVAGVEYAYILDGWQVSRSEFAHLRHRQQQGLHEEYYPLSHQRKVVSHFQQNKLNGELLSYYPTGQLKRREQYRDYVSQGGQCYNVEGQPISFVPYWVMAEFPGGLPELMHYVMHSVNYPKAERKLGHQRRVLVDFVVGAQKPVAAGGGGRGRHGPVVGQNAGQVVARQQVAGVHDYAARAAGGQHECAVCSGTRAPVAINALADKYLRLAYHGLRAKDKTFNAALQTDFAPDLPNVEGVGPDLGRVHRQHQGVGPQVQIRVRGNGTGMPESVKSKVFQPFFTTRPTGEGLGGSRSRTTSLARARATAARWHWPARRG